MSFRRHSMTFVISVILLLSMSVTGLTNQVEAAPDTVYYTFDLTKGGITGDDHPWGMECSVPNFVFETIDSNGGLLKINSTDPTDYTVIPNPDGDTGNNWYSVEYDGSDELRINERDNGLMWTYNIAGDSFTKKSIVKQLQNVTDVIIKYPNGFDNDPSTFTIDITSNGVGIDYTLNTNLGGHAGEIQHANGFIWVAVNYSIDLSAMDSGGHTTEKNAIISGNPEGVVFYGLVKIDPVTDNIVKHIDLESEGFTDVRGLTTDGTNLWITSQVNDKVFKFNTVTETVDQNISLTSGSNPRGVAVDSTYVYVALNKSAGGNSEVLRINKSDLTQTVLDTGVANTSGGTFSVFVADDALLWTDESGNTGSFIRPGNSPQTLSIDGNTSKNKFGCQVGDKFWFAGDGSVKAGVTTIPTGIISNDSSSDDSAWKTKPTAGKDWDNLRQIVDVGYSLNGEKITITDNWWTSHDLMTTNTGVLNTATMKVYAPYDLKWVEFYFGVPEVGKIHESRSLIHVPIDYIEKEIIKEGIVVEQESEFIVLHPAKAILDIVPCGGIGSDCYQITVYFIAKEGLDGKVLGIGATDTRNRYMQTHINDGLDIVGESLNPPDELMIASSDKHKRGLIQVFQIDRWNDIWTDSDGIKYQRNDFGTFIKISESNYDRPDDGEWKVMNRYHSSFDDLIQYEELRGKFNYWNSDLIQKTDKGFIPAPEIPEQSHRDITLQKLGW